VIFGRIVTELAPFHAFYPAESYHRDYYRRNPEQGYCQMIIAPKVTKFRKQFVVERIDVFQEEEVAWTQMLVEDRRAGPAEIAACRIDFADWLSRLTARLRRIALALASGQTTAAVAKMVGVSPARISQIRGLLKKSWETFQGETIEDGPQMAAA
jgi:hypothetical protein